MNTNSAVGIESLADKVIIVTGASSGMGRATALLLAQRGATLVLQARDAARIQTLQAEITAAGGAEACICLGDVAEASTAKRTVLLALERFRRLDGLVNAAGIIHRGDAQHTTDAQWRRVMACNVDGSFFMARAATAAMKSGGSIVNFASTCGLVGASGLAAYCASKGAIVQLTRAMALDGAATGVRVNAVCPGAVDTPMLLSGRAPDANVERDEVLANNLASIPQQRIPAAEEVAELVAFLLSDRSRHITGSNIPIDGGYTAQ